ncbi:hypothetical protein [Gallibacterium anatis]|uniref:hypothetical protein n=1 Tax=Gallibacterium anatis TaxID=750 RepID=UPI001E51FF7D|nr:hypothetical protein [Gallibacterium anatis]
MASVSKSRESLNNTGLFLKSDAAMDKALLFKEDISSFTRLKSMVETVFFNEITLSLIELKSIPVIFSFSESTVSFTVSTPESNINTSQGQKSKNKMCYYLSYFSFVVEKINLVEK